MEEQKKRIAKIDYLAGNTIKKKSGAYVDQETLLHNNHIRSGKSEQWKTGLAPLEVAFIEEHAYEWLVTLNYPISQNWLKRKYSVIVNKKKTNR